MQTMYNHNKRTLILSKSGYVKDIKITHNRRSELLSAELELVLTGAAEEIFDLVTVGGYEKFLHLWDEDGNVKERIGTMKTDWGCSLPCAVVPFGFDIDDSDSYSQMFLGDRITKGDIVYIGHNRTASVRLKIKGDAPNRASHGISWETLTKWLADIDGGYSIYTFEKADEEEAA